MIRIKMKSYILMSSVFILFTTSVKGFQDNREYEEIICKRDYRKRYPEYVLKKECSHPLIYNTNVPAHTVQIQKKFSCKPVRELKQLIRKDLIAAQKLHGAHRLIGFTYIYVLQGLDQLDTDKVKGRKISLTTPQTILKMIEYTKMEWFSEFGIDIEGFPEVDNYVMRLENGTMYVDIFKLAESYLHHHEIRKNDDDGTVFVYFDTKNRIWPDLQFFDRAHKTHRSHQTLHVMVPGHLVYPKYKRLLNIHNSTAPWRPDDVHREKRSIWCRGWRHLMALSEPVVKDQHGNIVFEPSGPRYCSVETNRNLEKCRCVYVTIYFDIHNIMKKNLKVNGTYGITVKLSIQDDGMFKAVSTELRLLWNETDKFDHDVIKSSSVLIRPLLAHESTMYSVETILLDGQNHQKIEIPRLAIEFDQDGVPNMFSKRYRIIDDVDETPSPFPPSMDAEDDDVEHITSPLTTSVETTTTTPATTTKPVVTTTTTTATTIDASSQICDCVKSYLDVLFSKLKLPECSDSTQELNPCKCDGAPSCCQSCECEPQQQGERRSAEMLSSDADQSDEEQITVHVKSKSRDGVKLKWLGVTSLLFIIVQ